MDYTDRLRLLALNDARLAEGLVGRAAGGASDLDPKALAPTRLAALVAVGGALPSYATQADAAPNLAMALGYDTEEAALER